MHLNRFCPESCLIDTSKNGDICPSCFLYEATEVTPRAIFLVTGVNKSESATVVGEVGNNLFVERRGNISMLSKLSSLIDKK